MKKRWSPREEEKAKEFLLQGKTCQEVADLLGRTIYSIQKKNEHTWNIDLFSVNYRDKLSRGVLKVSDRISQSQKGRWSGSKNPNYGGVLVKRGDENPLNVWKRNNPGYQNGDRNPSFGRKMSSEEIEIRTKGIVEFAHNRRGKTYDQIFGKVRSEEIRRAMSRGAVIRLSKQKSSGTKPELKMKGLLKSLDIEYDFQHPIGHYCVDFFLVNLNIVVLVDGCYWHGCPDHFTELNRVQKKNIRIDHSCNSYLKKKGYRVIRFWECELNNIQKEDVQCVLSE